MLTGRPPAQPTFDANGAPVRIIWENGGMMVVPGDEEPIAVGVLKKKKETFKCERFFSGIHQQPPEHVPRPTDAGRNSARSSQESADDLSQ